MIALAIIAAITARIDAKETKQHSRRIFRFLDEVNMIYQKNICEKMAGYYYSLYLFYFSIMAEKKISY